ncbi:MAG: N-6 DNA methylase [Proteobacteria bacterium]|nr:N-6 DNA methylase [Pseudomonadota bacterium]
MARARGQTGVTGKTATAAGASASRRRRRMRRGGHHTQFAFEAIAIEGGLLSPDWLARAAQLEAGGQSEADYRIPKGLDLRGEISRSWRIAQALWNDLSTGRAAAAGDEDRARALSERFVIALLGDCFGFGSLARAELAEQGGGVYPIGHAALDGRVPVVIAPAGAGLDVLWPAFADGLRRRSAFGLCQEYLNAEDSALWGLASDSATLRVLRDNASLTRPAWIEADLDRIFTEQRYAEFAALWLLVHETRFGRPGQPVTDCSLEQWREAGREQGTRAREQLRHAVEEALVALGQGFLAHPDNQTLRAALSAGTLTRDAYFQELLRLAYRLIFLLTVEERGVLHPPGACDASEKARKLYAEGYSLRRLRERAIRRSAHDRHHDHWETAKIAFRGLASGEPRLALPALAGIFGCDQCPMLDAARLDNRFFLLALFRLSWLRQDAGLARVNWRDMGAEELGSVYESLLELVPQITEGGRSFSFATGADARGHARKTTGSYYTPDSLVQELLDSALEPVVERTVAEHPGEPVDALLSLAIVDPACGSGHFLLAAARRLAVHLARLQVDGTPSAAEYRHALRQVIGRCIYGVDLNPMAVELCKVSLWMEAVEPGLPLTFVDAHIRHGNSLLGTTPQLMENGIPDSAWKAIEGDDKKVARALRKRNKQAAQGQRGVDTLWSRPATNQADELRRAVAAVESAPDADLDALARKQSRWQELLDSDAYRHHKLVADAWCAAFVWPKQPGPLAEVAPTNELWRQIRDGRGHPPELTVKTVNELAARYTFFHWHLAFPNVFARGGFDVVLGNPPWEKIKLAEREFFASRSEEIARAANARVRKKLISELPASDPQLWAEWCVASRNAIGESHLARQCGRYPHCGRGDVNTYALFAEHIRSILRGPARAGFIVPTGLATDETTSQFFSDLMESGSLVCLFDFENRQAVFPGVHRGYKFALVTLRGAGEPGRANRAEFVFFAHGIGDLANPARRYPLTSAEIALVNPRSRTCPVFRTRRDAEITKRLYARSVVLGSAETDAWCAEYLLKMVDPTIHRGLLVSRSDLSSVGESLVPLYEGKSVYQFDHRYALFESQDEHRALTPREKLDPQACAEPRYWLRAEDFTNRLQGRPVHYRGFLSVRDITNVTNERTVVTAIRPFVPALNSLGNLFCESGQEALFLCGCLNSFAADYIARQKIGGTHLSPFYLLQLAVIAKTDATGPAPWDPVITSDRWTIQRVLELTYTAWDLESFARDVGYDGPPFRWNAERRFLLRAELDAAFFHLYGVERDDVDYIMETFPIVRKNDEKAYGEYRTKCVILDIYDEIAEAIRTGTPYQTRLDPPPAA